MDKQIELKIPGSLSPKQLETKLQLVQLLNKALANVDFSRLYVTMASAQAKVDQFQRALEKLHGTPFPVEGIRFHTDGNPPGPPGSYGVIGREKHVEGRYVWRDLPAPDILPKPLKPPSKFPNWLLKAAFHH